MAKMIDYREESREPYGIVLLDGKSMDREGLLLGAVLRIADATELMAGNFRAMETDLKYYRELSGRRSDQIAVLERQIAALKGVITKMRNKNGNMQGV